MVSLWTVPVTIFAIPIWELILGSESQDGLGSDLRSAIFTRIFLLSTNRLGSSLKMWGIPTADSSIDIIVRMSRTQVTRMASS